MFSVYDEVDYRIIMIFLIQKNKHKINHIHIICVAFYSLFLFHFMNNQFDHFYDFLL